MFNPKRRLSLLAVSVTALALVAAACSSGSSKTDTTDAAGGSTSTTVKSGFDYGSLSGSITASGASFPDAFYQATIDEFSKVSDLKVTYNSVGSGQGKKDFGAGLTNFGGTDSLVKAGDGPADGTYLYVPTVAAPITVSYHLSGVKDLKLSADTLAKIFQAEVTTWNDPAIAADNSGTTLPSTKIVVAHRSDGSGTTSNFTKYLTAAAPTVWKLGGGDTVAWPPSSQGGAKNTGVAQIVKDNEGAIGYVDLSDAEASGLVFASIKNKAGSFVAPTLAGASAALAGATVNADLSYSPLNAGGKDAYPITAPTFLLLRTTYKDQATLDNVKGFVTYVLNEGQDQAADVSFAKLPEALRTQALAQLEKVTVG